MKKSIIQFSLIISGLFFCSFQTNTHTLQNIFQTALSIEELNNYLEKDAAGNFLPLVISSNQLIPDDLSLNHKGTAIKIVGQQKEIMDIENSILELTELKLKGKKSILSFKYQEKTIKIRLKKEEEKWVSKVLTVKWKNGFESTLVTSIEKHF